MGKARASVRTTGPISAAEALWYDLRRWPSFIDGFGHVAAQEGDWPKLGARVVWDSGRDGRGRVNERVVAYEARVGQTVEVADPKLTGTQRISFRALAGDEIEVSLELDYRLEGTSFGGPIVDVLFIRRALADSLDRTLTRFVQELRSDRGRAAERTSSSGDVY